MILVFLISLSALGPLFLTMFSAIGNFLNKFQDDRIRDRFWSGYEPQTPGLGA